ncbi:acetyl esterase/lipase [Actinocorallia herbida]|uniref:Acetyl esterase/lipase n=1 Tax=Actinocorallia herbida TaxID=58109 RepID=A0A3N1CY09_9ACTN|nr:alpha/beta hydrolase [Actinocorallia herbida]ROO86187.1 acetyl esterase/lipase [Actinocorallia herbida]
MTFPFELLAPPDPAVLPLPPAAEPEPGVRLVSGAVYDVPDGRRPLELDLWLPADAAAPVPVIVFVHGGAWRTGLRTDLGPRFRSWRPGPFAHLVRAGFAVACPTYRLSGEAAHPAQRDDLGRALDWLHARAGELGLDTSRTMLWGESAGGHLAALTALTRPWNSGATVTGCIAWYAPSDFLGLAEDSSFDPTAPGTFEALFLGAPPADVPDRAVDASPARQATGEAPAFLVLHGTADSLVPFAQSERLAAALTAAGAPVEFRPVEGADHLWVGIPDEAVADCFSRSLAFSLAVTSHTRPGQAGVSSK